MNSDHSAIAADILANRRKPIPNEGDKAASLNVNGGVPGGFVQSFQGLVDHWVGYLVLVNHEVEQDGQHVSNSAAVRVDNVSEVVRVLEVLFKR